MDCSPPASSVLEMLQARILKWAAISFSQMEREREREKGREREREMLFSSCGAGKTEASPVSFWAQNPQKGLHHWPLIPASVSHLKLPGKAWDSG